MNHPDNIISDNPRYFSHYDGDERAWRIYDTAVEDDLDGLWRSDAGMTAALSALESGASVKDVLSDMATRPDARLPLPEPEEDMCDVCGHWSDEHVDTYCEACRLVGNPDHAFSPETKTP